MNARRALRWLLGKVLLVVIGLGLAEVAVRLVGPDFDLAYHWRYHSVLGWSQVPGGEVDYEVGTQDANVVIELQRLTGRVVVVAEDTDGNTLSDFEVTYRGKDRRCHAPAEPR